MVICDAAWFDLPSTQLSSAQLNSTQLNSTQLIFIMLVERIKVTAVTASVQPHNK